MPKPTLKEAVEWRPRLWGPAVHEGLRMAERFLTPGSRVLEVGYYSGMMSCYLASNYGVRITGYDTKPHALALAEANAQRFRVNDQTDFRIIDPADTQSITGSFDLVLMKSFLFHVPDPSAYLRWLEWSRSVLSKEGALLAIENGKGPIAARRWRSRKHKFYADRCLFDSRRLADFRKTFGSVDALFYGLFGPTSRPDACLVAVILAQP